MRPLSKRLRPLQVALECEHEVCPIVDVNGVVEAAAPCLALALTREAAPARLFAAHDTAWRQRKQRSAHGLREHTRFRACRLLLRAVVHGPESDACAVLPEGLPYSGSACFYSSKEMHGGCPSDYDGDPGGVSPVRAITKSPLSLSL